MSSSIDNRVVSMEFDNKNFERNVDTSLGTLDRLNTKLGDTKGSTAFATNLTTALSTVNQKFSALEIAGIAVLSNLAIKAANTGLAFVKSLSIGQLTSGFSKYEDKTRSVATLLAQGFDLDVVTAQLERLNWFTDETSYNFTDMVSNIGKFTAAGQDLESSVTAMEGIANWAALSGQNAAVASRAMYQLSQAMSSGRMRREDYKSIQTANMDTQEFRKAALAAGVAMGNLRKNADGTYTTIGKSLKRLTFKESQFVDYLTETGWFTSEVMMKVFKTYSSAVDQIYDYAEEKGLTASEAMEELADKLDEFGLKAFGAAQKARTFSDVIDSVKDAVSTGWMTTFELIFGNADEAIQMWTDLSNYMYNVFAESGNTRNDILREWYEAGGRTTALQGIYTAFQQLQEILDGISLSIRKVFGTFKPVFKEIDKAGKNFEAANAEVLGEYSEIINSGHLLKLSEGIYNFGQKLRELKERYLPAIQTVIETLAGYAKSIFDYLGPKISELKKFLGSLVPYLENILVKAWDIFTTVVPFIGRLFTKLEPLGSIIKNIVTQLMRLASGSAGKISEFFVTLPENIKKLIDSLPRAVKNLGDFFKNLAGTIGGGIGKLIANFFTELSQGDLTKIFSGINGGIFSAVMYKWFLGDSKSDKKIKDGLLTIIDKIKNFNLKSKLEGAVESITGSLSSFKEKIAGMFTGKQEQSFTTQLMQFAKAIAILSASLILLSMVDSAKLLIAVGALVLLGKGIQVIMGGFSKLAAQLKVLKDGREYSRIIKNMVPLATALLVLAFACAKLGSMNLSELVKGVTAAGVLLLELAGFIAIIKVLPASQGNGKAVKGMIPLAAAIYILALAVGKIGKIPQNQLENGVKAVGVLLAMLGVFTMLSNGAKRMVSIGIGTTILAAGLLVLSKAVSALGQMEGKTLAIGFSAIALALIDFIAVLKTLPADSLSKATSIAVLATALVIMAKALEKMNKINNVWSALGSMGLAILMLTTALVALGEVKNLAGVAASLLILGVAFNSLTKAFINMQGIGFWDIAKALLALVGAMYAIGLMAKLMDKTTGPLLKFSLSMALIGAGAVALAAALNFLATSVTGTVGVLAATIKPFINGLVDFILLAIEALVEQIPKIINILLEMLISICEGLAIAINNNAPGLVQAIFKLVGALINLVLSAVELLLGKIPGIGKFITGWIDDARDSVSNFFGLSSGKESGKDFATGLAEGVEESTGEVKDSIWKNLFTVTDTISDYADTDAVQAGANMVAGLADGVETNSSILTSTVSDLANNAIFTFNSVLGIHSPSRVFAEAGKYIDLGIISGVEEYSDRVRNSVESLGSDASDSFTSSIASISAAAMDDISEPVIRPVLDLSQVRAGASTIGSMFGSRTLGYSAQAANASMASYMSTGDIVNTINDLKSNFNNLSESISNMKVVMNSGQLVGSISTKMDKALGTMATYKGRNN